MIVNGIVRPAPEPPASRAGYTVFLDNGHYGVTEDRYDFTRNEHIARMNVQEYIRKIEGKYSRESWSYVQSNGSVSMSRAGTLVKRISIKDFMANNFTLQENTMPKVPVKCPICNCYKVYSQSKIGVRYTCGYEWECFGDSVAVLGGCLKAELMINTVKARKMTLERENERLLKIIEESGIHHIR